MRFKLFKWSITTKTETLEEYIDLLESKGWASVGTTVIETHDGGLSIHQKQQVRKGDPSKVIIHCVAQPKDGE